MKIVSVCDSSLSTGFRLVGIEEQTIDAINDPNVAIVIISKEIAALHSKQVEEARLKSMPLIVEV